MNDMKCPFCQQELETWAKYTDGTSKVWCSKCNLLGDSKLFSELIRTKELLDIESSEHDLCHDALVERTKELDRTRKALDRAKLILKNLLPYLNGYERLDVKKALAEITALEQKDVK